MPELMTLEETAKYLRVTEKTIHRLLNKKGIPSTRVGRQWRFDKIAIDAWLKESVKAAGNILVIDDDNEICELFRDTLESAGHTVTTVNDPLKGLELVEKGDYNFIFLDLKLPAMDGAEVLGRIKSFKPDIPVMVVTGFPEGELVMRALSYGPLGIMKKPFKPGEVLDAIKINMRSYSGK
jgi:excisionase family DNA binding protein